MRARVVVTLKAGVLDPQGKAIEGALASLGIAGIAGVRQGKMFDIELAGEDRSAAEAALRQACERLLANTVIETYRIELDGGSAAAPAPVAEPASAAEPPPAPAPAPVAAPADVTEIAAAHADMPTEGHP